MNHNGYQLTDLVDLMLQIIECLSGPMGMRPIMQPFLSEANQQYLLRRMQEHARTEEERAGQINMRTGEKTWQAKKLDEAITRKAIPDVLFPFHIYQKVPQLVSEAANISPYEFDRLLEWQMKPLSQAETQLLTNLVRETIEARKQDRGFAAIKPAYEHYSTVMALQQQYYLTSKAPEQALTDAPWGDLEAQNYLRAQYQAVDLSLFVTHCLMAGYLLEKEPVFDTSHVYKDVEYNRRTYSDLREELVTKLVSLPPYQAIIHLASQSGELPVQILTPRPLQISLDAEPKANAMREESRRKLGHPWQEVVKDIQTRQNLPLAKPQI
jgi:hypothetical protein